MDTQKPSAASSVTCAHCAEVGHDNTNCDMSESCVNCKGDHLAFSRLCPKWIFEKEIQAVKTIKNISYLEAHKHVGSKTPSIGLFYSNITSILTSGLKSDASTQTAPTCATPPPKSYCSVGIIC